MKLPFSHEDFLDVFGAYNSALWPAIAVLWLLTAGVAWRWLRRGQVSGRLVLAMLAVHWAWSGIAYHWFYFRAINPVAALFALLFALQAALFGWLAWRAPTDVLAAPGWRTSIAPALVLYGLVYPGVGVILGLKYPRLPLFAVPCPTTLVSAGFLVATAGIPRIARVVPLLWAGIGTSAALALGILSDWALAAAAAALALDLLLPAGPRPKSTA